MDNKSLEAANNLIKVFADPCNDPIYHYTSAEGAMGIIENNEVWLTNTEFVNDTSEGKALKQDFKDTEALGITNPYVKDKWKFKCNFDDDYNTYIASFSHGPESLSQWRAYGSFRIGFKANGLIKRGCISAFTLRMKSNSGYWKKKRCQSGRVMILRIRIY